MEKRTAESPMDFEWQTRGPGDVTSPFFQLGLQKKRPHSTFDSPEKKSMPSLREPNSQPFLFSESKRPAPPQSVFGQPAFMTPRKFDLDFSSGAENMSSPENADNEVTPDPSSKTSKVFGRWAPSPGRGEIPRLNHYSNALARRVQKRRRRDRELDKRLRRDDEEEDDDSDRPISSDGRKGKGGKAAHESQATTTKGSRLSSFSEFFALLEAHPNVPSILSWWAQLVVNLSLFSLTVYVVFGFVSTIRAEFDQAAEEVSDSILAEMATCAKNYVDNRCAGNERLPALETVCDNWERCMNRDPAKVGRAKVSAHTMAIIINSFIDPISWKAILFFLATISTVTVVSNWSFRSFRNKYSQHEYHPVAPNYHAQPASQPHPAMQLQNNPAFGYFAQPDLNKGQSHPIPKRVASYEHKDEDSPLMIEDANMKFVTERSRERENHLRTPSPSKRGRKYF
ncbi:hypothetical protein ASPZODRAFT_126613 [Penicilliopsis zonata CBS 506.65]|uniref:Brl1/Brr6 domain-containing protein n=1 Tax=Penicilliopsis zonata CBS 506.65 TaxID=1073090 RepID=A0A1L9SU89_9EURO|nr:hypothetical protein ASPZODRAFT_126613 [Penicilliopsis zonata CBS 506.65]OJJ50691.1 hypothetical protein ASPZODRAFT_126613 [Penicilliopsis zonata CBS 506.65]